MNKVVVMIKKLSLIGMEYAHCLIQWLLKLIKIQMQKFKKSGARKSLNKAYRGLGAEIYAHYKQGADIDWSKMPGAEQQLRRVEEAESKLLSQDEAVQYINAQHSAKRTEIREKYSAKRGRIG
jgi:hypothetical protein